MQACKHLYKENKGGKIYGLGQCISMDNQLDELDYFTPCKALDKRNIIKSWGLCQAGTSAALDEVRQPAPVSGSHQGSAR